MIYHLAEDYGLAHNLQPVSNLDCVMVKHIQMDILTGGKIYTQDNNIHTFKL